MKPVGQLQYFRSKVDGKLHPCAVCATNRSHEPKPLILEVSPGAISDLSAAVAQTEEIAGMAARHGRSCVVLRPTGRGPGSVYQNYGEVDVLEAIDHVAAHFPIDRERITITGSSMGGAAVWYLISHYPDLFAGAAPFCGYCDYRLWEKPGGLTFHMHPWEEASWKARSAALLVENLEHTPVWMVHGGWDRAVGGGVPVEHSRQMARLLQEQGYSFEYTEVPQTGHGCRQPEIWEQVVLWLLDQQKVRQPDHLTLSTYALRHSSSFWVAIEQLQQYGEQGLVDAGFVEGRLAVRTEGIRTLSLGPVEKKSPVPAELDGQDLGMMDFGQRQRFRRDEEGNWEAGDFDLSREKRPGCSGPVGDLFHEGLLLVVGTAGAEEETFFNRWVAEHTRGYFRMRNGGVHRGGIMGENWVDLVRVEDRALAEDDLVANNLLLFGNGTSNSVLGRFAGDLPLEFGENSVRLADNHYRAEGVSAFAIFPHPLNPQRYAAVHGGATPDGICWGSHLDMQLLPDFLVYAGGQVLDWGFWDNEWRTPE